MKPSIISQEDSQKAYEYVHTLLTSFYACEGKELTYHSLSHTFEEVVKTARELAIIEDMSPCEIALEEIAALFHDTGFIDCYNDNEEYGAQRAQKYLVENNFTKSDYNIVYNAICKTNLSLQPHSLFEKVLKDADVSYLGASDFTYFQQRVLDLREESQNYPCSPLHEQSLKSEIDWYKSTIDFMQHHEFHTNSARNLLEKNKDKNLKNLIDIISSSQKD